MGHALQHLGIALGEDCPFFRRKIFYGGDPEIIGNGGAEQAVITGAIDGKDIAGGGRRSLLTAKNTDVIGRVIKELYIAKVQHIQQAVLPQIRSELCPIFHNHPFIGHDVSEDSVRPEQLQATFSKQAVHIRPRIKCGETVVSVFPAIHAALALELDIGRIANDDIKSLPGQIKHPGRIKKFGAGVLVIRIPL